MRKGVKGAVRLPKILVLIPPLRYCGTHPGTDNRRSSRSLALSPRRDDLRAACPSKNQRKAPDTRPRNDRNAQEEVFIHPRSVNHSAGAFDASHPTYYNSTPRQIVLPAFEGKSGPRAWKYAQLLIPFIGIYMY